MYFFSNNNASYPSIYSTSQIGCASATNVLCLKERDMTLKQTGPMHEPGAKSREESWQWLTTNMRTVCELQWSGFILITEIVKFWFLDFVASYLKDLQRPTWIGLSDLLVENQYAWSDGVSPVRYTNWNEKEPNNAGGTVRSDLKNTKWTVQICVLLFTVFTFCRSTV